ENPSLTCILDMNDNQPPVIKSLHDLIVAWVRHVEHVPRMHRHTLGARITESLLDAQMHVFRAQPLGNRLEKIEAAQASITLAKYTLRVLVDIKALPVKKMAHLASLLVPIEKQLSGWKKQVVKDASLSA
ncbi:MAG: four helix bundle protein, partial [Bacteroidetes bacterium]|nr:four helix bundle protein [Bacteroidota bacterium]